MIKNIYEILDEFSKANTREERKEVLQTNASAHFRQFLKYTFDPIYEFYVKDFPKDYVEPDTFPGLRIAGIESELRRTYLFTKGDPTADALTEDKRNILLLQLLESFEPKEAEVYVNMLKKDLKVPFLTEKLVREVFPDLLTTN